MNDNHKRVLSAYLDDMERKLRDVEGDLAIEPRRAPALAHNPRPDMNEQTRVSLLEGISGVLNEIESMRDEYGLKAEERSARKHAVSVLVDIWVTINELRPKSLENYGSLTQADKQRLDSDIEKLLKILDTLFSTIKERSGA